MSVRGVGFLGQLKMWLVVCESFLQCGHSSATVGFILELYDASSDEYPLLSCASFRLVSRGSCNSEGSMGGGVHEELC